MDMKVEAGALTLRQPQAQDGADLHALIESCPPLDLNAVYCYLLLCSHFAATSVVAERDGELLGAITGYRPPQQPDTLFIWQVAVSDKARGEGLARRMLNHIVDRQACDGVQFMETTVTGDNRASWALFESFARQREAQIERGVLFERERHFRGAHDSEILARIGPFSR